MKKISVYLLCLFALACSKSDESDLSPQGNCDQLSERYTAALNAYVSNPSVSNCQSLKTTLNNLVGKCAILTAQQKKEYQDAIADLTCN